MPTAPPPAEPVAPAGRAVGSLPPPPPPLDEHVAGAVSGAPVAGPPAGNRRWWRLAGLGVATAAGCAYVGLYDPSTSSALYPQCPFKLLTGWDCPGCGVTRALHALVTGDPARALDHNVVFVLALPLLAFLLVRSVARSLGRRAPGGELRWQPWMTVVAAVVVGGFWLARNLPPFGWLASGAG